MKLFVMAAFGVGAGVGLWVCLCGLRGRAVLGRRAAPARSSTSFVRLACVATGALLVLAVTGWIVGACFAAFAAWTLPGLVGGRGKRERAIGRTEAIASWTEMIRDSIAAASGLEEAIIATGGVAPAPISAEVRALVRRLEQAHTGLPEALVAFGDDIKHPSADLVVAALVLASRLEANDLSSLLTRLAEAIRGEARMRIRVEVGRTRVRTATRVIVGVVVAAVAFLALANRDYLSVYGSFAGQVVLAFVGATFIFGGWLLSRMAAIEMPERFTARAVEPGAA